MQWISLTHSPQRGSLRDSSTSPSRLSGVFEIQPEGWDWHGCASHRDLIVALLGPLAAGRHNGGVVHLVDRHDELGHPQRLGQLCVLAGLAAAIETRLELALPANLQRHQQKLGIPSPPSRFCSWGVSPLKRVQHE